MQRIRKIIGRLRGGDARGFSIIDSLVSLSVASAGMLAVAGLMATGATVQQRSREGGRSGMAAIQFLEQLRMLPRSDARVSVGGSLTANVANHNALINVAPMGQVQVRWLVQAGPAGSLDITVRAVPVIAGPRPSEARSLVWR
jgi:Tfp pilus assembly protein PilV